jgi:hypothetical protein
MPRASTSWRRSTTVTLPVAGELHDARGVMERHAARW